MTRIAAALLFLCAVSQSECPPDSFRFSLGPPEDSSIDQRLLGEWECRVTGSPEPAFMTFLDFDGRQYYMRVVSEEDPFQARAYSTSLPAATILNVAELGEDADEAGERQEVGGRGADAWTGSGRLSA